MTQQQTSAPGASAPVLTIALVPITGSSNIVGIGYDAPTKTLDIQFASGVHRYASVPAKVHENFLAAPSKGKFFAQEIRNIYASAPLPKPKAEEAPAALKTNSAWPFPSR